MLKSSFGLTLALGLACACLASCGGASNGTAEKSGSVAGATAPAAVTSEVAASGAGGKVVARVGSTAITRGAVSHWMETLAGGDYYELSKQHTVPAGLVSDPPDYPRCVASLENAQANAPRPGTLTGTKLLTECRLIYQQLRKQATEYLIKNAILINAYREQGITVTEAEVLKGFNHFKAETFPSSADQQAYLTKRRRTLSDELVIIKLNLLEAKIQKKLTSASGKAAFVGFLQAQQRWTIKTTCSPGYVIEDCSNYKPEPAPSKANTSPAILMEQVAAIATSRCTNVAACGKL